MVFNLDSQMDWCYPLTIFPNLRPGNPDGGGEIAFLMLRGPGPGGAWVFNL
jgi:hypothetical protein